MVDALASGVSVLTSVRTLTPEASASTNSATFAQLSYFLISPRWCEGGDLNPHVRKNTNT